MRLTLLPRTVLLLLLAGCTRPAAQPSYDLVISGGSVLDGNGTPAVTTDIGVRDGRIAAIGNLRDAAAAIRLGASA